MADPWGGSSSSPSGTPVVADRRSPSEGGFWGFFGNAWEDVKDIGRSVGTIGGTILHDTWNAARQSVLKMPWTDPAEIAAQQAQGDPAGAMVLDNMYNAVAGEGEFEETGSVLLNDYQERYGEEGLGGGNFDTLYEHPLSFITDALTLATAGGYGAAKVGQLAGKAAVAGKVGEAATVTGRAAQLARSVQGAATRIHNPVTGKVETVGAAFNPTRRLLYQNRYLQATSKPTKWHEARADKFSRMADALGENAPQALEYAAQSNAYRSMVEHAHQLGATRILRPYVAKHNARKWVDRMVGAAVGASQVTPEGVLKAWDDSFKRFDPELVSPADIANSQRALDTDLTSDHIVAPVGRGTRRAEVFNAEGVQTQRFGDEPITWGNTIDVDDTPEGGLLARQPLVLPLRNVKDTPEQTANILGMRQRVFDAGSDPQYAYRFQPAEQLDSIQEKGLLDAEPADKAIDPTAQTGVYFSGNAKDAYQSVPLKGARNSALLRVRRGENIQPTTGIQGENFQELIAKGGIQPKDIDFLDTDGHWKPLVPERVKPAYSSGNEAVDKAVAAAHATRTKRDLPVDDQSFDTIAAYLDEPDSPFHERFMSLIDDEGTSSLRDGVFMHKDRETGMVQYWHTENGTQVDAYLEMTSDGHLTSVAAKSKQDRGLGRQLLLKHWDEQGIDSPEEIIAEVQKQSLSRKGAALYRSAAGERLGQVNTWRGEATESVKVRGPQLRRAFKEDAQVVPSIKGERAWKRKAELVGSRRAVTDGERYRVIHEDAFDGAKQQGLVDRVQQATGDKVRQVENQVDAPGVDGSRELRVIMEAADDGHPYEVSILTRKAAEAFDATTNTRAMYNSLAVLARRGASNSDTVENVKYLENLQQHIWEGVTDDIRVARGGPAPAELRRAINDFRTKNYAMTTDPLLGRGLSPRSAFENAYLPVRIQGGAKKDAKTGNYVGGSSPLEMDDAFAKSGEMAPMYYPHMAVEDIPKRGAWLMRRGGPTTGAARRRLDDVNLRRNTGELLSTGRASTDSRAVYHIRAAQSARLQENMDMLFDAVTETGRPLRHPEDFNPEVERLFAPGLVKQMADQHNMLLDELANDPTGKGLGDLISKLEVDNAARAKELLDSGGDIEVWAVPKVVADRLQEHSKWILNEGIDATWGSTTRMWRSMVLAGSPRWVVNNLLGNTAMSKLAGVRMRDVVRMANRKYYDEVLEAMGPDARKGVTGSLHSSLKVEPHRFSDNTILTTAANWTQRKVGGSRVVNRGRKLADNVQRFNSALEDRFRAATYLTAANKRVIRQQGKSFWDNFGSFKKRVDNTFKAGLDENTWRSAVDDVNKALNDYHTSSPMARNLIKPYLAPFWSFYGHAAKTILRMPFDHPAKATALALISEMEDERMRNAGVHPEDMPGWMRGSSLFLGHGEAGDARFLSTAGANPFNAVMDTPLDLLHPGGKMFYEQGTGRSTFTGRKFTDPNVVESFGSEQQYRVQEGSEPKAIERVTPSLLEHLLQQVPQYEMVKDLLAGGTTYDTTDLLDVLRYRIAGGEDVVPRAEDGSPISARGLVDTLGRIFGYSEYDTNMAKLHERRLEEKKAALAEYAKRKGLSSSGGGAAGDPWG